MRRSLAALLASGLLAALPAAAADYIAGTVTHVRDGDTIEIGNTAIRLRGLTCDELGSTLGEGAKTFMQGLVEGRQALCSLTGRKTYDREEGACTVDGEDIAALAISTGICGRCPAYDSNQNYTAAAKAAGPYVGRMPSYCKK